MLITLALGLGLLAAQTAGLLTAIIALPTTAAHFYASEEWVAKNRLPKTLKDLGADSLVAHEDAERFVAYLKDLGLHLDHHDVRLISANSIVVWELVKQGLGITPMLREVAERTPGIVRIFPDLPAIPVPHWLVTHRELQTSRRIRIVFDILAEELGRRPEK